MKLPKEVRKYCPYCRRHTVHIVKIVKSAPRRGGLSFGARRAREAKKGKGNKGKYSKRPMSQRKRVGVKGGSKCPDIRLVCKECGKATIMVIGERLKKFEIKTT